MTTPKKPKNGKGARLSRNKVKTDYLIILDESGSMEACRKETISNFNEQVQTIKDAARGQDVKVSLVVFNSPGEARDVLWRKPIEAVEPLTNKLYRPNGVTALYDAIQASVTQLSAETEGGKKRPAVLVVIISDGQENSSRHARQKDIAELIQEMTKTGRWSFGYMGANQDLSQVHQDLHIPMGNMMAYSSTPQGTKSAGRVMGQSLQGYTSSVAMGHTQSDSLFSRDGSIADADSKPLRTDKSLASLMQKPKKSADKP